MNRSWIVEQTELRPWVVVPNMKCRLSIRNQPSLWRICRYQDASLIVNLQVRTISCHSEPSLQTPTEHLDPSPGRARWPWTEKCRRSHLRWLGSIERIGKNHQPRGGDSLCWHWKQEDHGLDEGREYRSRPRWEYFEFRCLKTSTRNTKLVTLHQAPSNLQNL